MHSLFTPGRERERCWFAQGSVRGPRPKMRSRSGEVMMGIRLCAVLMLLLAIPLFCQAPSPNPQVATMTAVNLRPKDAENGWRGPTQYDVSLKVDDVIYVV